MKKQILHEKIDFTNMRQLLEWAGDEHGDKCAFSYRSTPLAKDIIRISFNQLRQEVRSLASELISMGCNKKHCAVVGKLSYDWALLYFSLLSAGAILVPLDKDWHQQR